MLVSADLLRADLQYTAWASHRLVEAASGLTAEELARDFQTADKTVLGTLVHVFAADRIWFARVTGAPVTAFVSDADYQLSVLQNDWPPLLNRWQQWAATLTDASLQETLSYTDTKGNPFGRPLWQVVLHVVNHGTHHRCQVSGFLRAMGHTPPPLDELFYFRQLDQTAKA